MMNENRWINLGERMIAAAGSRERARLLVDEVPASTLAGLGLTRTGSSAAMAVGAFTVGALIGAGAVIFLAPGSEAVREELSVQLRRTKRLARVAASRARKRTERVAKNTVERVAVGFDDMPPNEQHDAHA